MIHNFAGPISFEGYESIVYTIVAIMYFILLVVFYAVFILILAVMKRVNANFLWIRTNGFDTTTIVFFIVWSLVCLVDYTLLSGRLLQASMDIVAGVYNKSFVFGANTFTHFLLYVAGGCTVLTVTLYVTKLFRSINTEKHGLV